jgi:hypothetical protein
MNVYLTVCGIQITSAIFGHAVAQAVSRWLPTAAARVRVRAEHVGSVVDKAAMGYDFSECFGFPCQSPFRQFLHHHNRPGLAQYAYWWPQCLVDPIGLHPPLYQFDIMYLDKLRKRLRSFKLGYDV